jgi:RNA polymerase sigma factor (sigma-70 family)
MGKTFDLTSEPELFEALRTETPAAFEHLYRHHYRMTAAYVTQNGGSGDDAQDVFQETLVALVKNLRKPDFALQAKLSTYLYAVARKIWLYRRRGQTANTPIENQTLAQQISDFPDLTDETLSEKTAHEQKHLLMARIFAQIGADCRELLRRYYYEDTPLKDIARIMGFTEAFVRVKKNRCMNDFRSRVADDSAYQTLQN